MACLFSFNQVCLTHAVIFMQGYLTEGVFPCEYQPGSCGGCAGNSRWHEKENQKYSLNPRDPNLAIMRSNWIAVAFSSFIHHNRNTHLSCHRKTCAMCLPPIWLIVVWGGGVLMCWTVQMDGIWCTTPGLHLHKEGWGATCCRACWWSLYVWRRLAYNRCLRSRAQLWQVAAAGWLWCAGWGGGGSRKVDTYKRLHHKERLMDGCPWSWADWTELEDDITAVLLLLVVSRCSSM